MEQITIQDFDAIQALIDMIEINTNHLIGLRTQCSLSENLTQAEIRTVETKLVKLFSTQFLEKLNSKNNNENIPLPNLKKWLIIVGLTDSLIEELDKKLEESFINLYNCTDKQLLNFTKNNTKDDERKLISSTNKLKNCIEKLKKNRDQNLDEDFYWDSWLDSNLDLNKDNNNFYSYNNNVKKEINLGQNKSKPKPSKEFDKNSNLKLYKDRKPTPPPTPPPSIKNNFSNKKDKVVTNINKNYNTNSSSENSYNYSFITKSKSHEDNLTKKNENLNKSDFLDQNNQKRLDSELSPDFRTNLTNSRSQVVVSSNANHQNDSCLEETLSLSSISTPRSPRTHGMKHSIKHRFVNIYWPKTINCKFCGKQMIFGVKCRECKFRCHRECADKVPPSCGLPPQLVNVFKETLNIKRSPLASTSLLSKTLHFNKNKAKSSKKKSSPTSSPCNSTAPSSPIYSNQTNNSSSIKAFNFNNNADYNSYKNQKDDYNKFDTLDNCNQNNLSRINSTDSNYINDEKVSAIRLNSQESQTSDYDQNEPAWPRQNSLTLKEWDIPFDELVKEKEIGTGLFGTVFKGKWHGSVAIKMFNMANGLDNKEALEAFRSEIATLRKTRHENLVLFMGSCMKPPHLAIVTSYCQGLPLYTHLYERKEKFNLNRIISIGQQISQGMGYLHARGIVHKDLRSKNIFYDTTNNKVIITDFGFFSLKLCFSNDKYKGRLKIHKGWLCYLAPELMKALRPGNNQDQEDLPFSFFTDIFSFGTIWHELIFGVLPFKDQPAEVVIWQVGKGIKQSLINLQASKEIKDILMICWAYKPIERPEFSKLVDILTNLPKKRLQRSPSHPTHLIRSLDSIY